MRFFIWYLRHDKMFVDNSAWCALIAQGLVQLGGAYFETRLTKLTCEKSREAFRTADCVSDVKNPASRWPYNVRLLHFIDYSLSKCLAELITIAAVRAGICSGPGAVRTVRGACRSRRYRVSENLARGQRKRGCDLTCHVKATHAIRKILPRQITI